MTSTLSEAPAAPPTRPHLLADHRPAWAARHQLGLAALDAGVIALALAVSLVTRFGDQEAQLQGVPYLAVAVAIGLLWWAALALARAYEIRFLGDGTEEFRRVGVASLRIAAALGVICFLLRLPLSRGFVAILLPLGTLGLLLGRGAARAFLRHRRRTGRWRHRVVAIGSASSVAELVRSTQRFPTSGLHVVAACVPGGRAELGQIDVSHLTDAAATVRRTRADTVAVTGWPGMTPESMTQLAYSIEGAHVDLLVAPALLPTAGAHAELHTVGGISLLELPDAQLPVTSRAVKRATDLVAGSLALVLLLPLVAIAALAMRLTSRGPLLFRERWVGRDGTEFVGYRLRTWEVAAPHHDPTSRRAVDQKRTRVGRVLERTLLNDAPQLVNVVRGQMSLVGPRPVPPGHRRSDAPYLRRLSMKPGLTGLAQVSHHDVVRTDEAFLLDLHYVESWSFSLDLTLLLKTGWLLLRGRRLQ